MQRLFRRAALACFAFLLFMASPASAQKLDPYGALDADGDPVYHATPQLAEFPGGMEAFDEFVRDGMRYPPSAWSDREEGKVVVVFVIEKDGSLSQVEATVFPSYALAKAAERLVSDSPKWKPAMLDGKKVSQRMSCLVHYVRDEFDRRGKRK